MAKETRLQWAETEITRLRECLNALSASSGQNVYRFELNIHENPTTIRMCIVSSAERSEQQIADIILDYLGQCGFDAQKKAKE